MKIEMIERHELFLDSHEIAITTQQFDETMPYMRSKLSGVPTL